MKTLAERVTEFEKNLDKLRKLAAVLYPEEIKAMVTFTSKLGGK